MRFVLVGSPSDIRTTIFNGTVDCISSLSPDLFYELREIPKLQSSYSFFTPEGSTYDYIGMNTKGSLVGRKPFFEDDLVRKAVAHLIDVDYLIEKVQHGLAKRISSDFPAHSPEFQNKDLELLDFDLNKAKTLLTASGWLDEDGDGILEREFEGRKVPFEVEILLGDNKSYRKLIAEHVKESLLKAGIRVELREVPWNVYLAMLENRDFDLMLGAWASDPNENSYHQVWHSAHWKKGSNWVGYGDEHSDALIEAFDHETDPEKRKTLAKSIQAGIYQQQAYIFLWRPTQCILVNKKFQSVSTYPVRPGFWAAEWQIQ